LSFKEIAEALEQPLGTVLARQHRALKKLAELLSEAMDGRSSPRPSGGISHQSGSDLGAAGAEAGIPPG
jgi:hypothetical protein